MNDPLTPEQIRESIVPKSDQLNADDLITGPLTVTITNVKRGDREQPIVVELDGQRPYKPCKTMRRVLIAAFSDDPKAWIGQRMTLYCDPNVTWAGVKVGGIRISHLSIAEPRTFLLTQTRGKKAEVVIMPIPPVDSKEQAYIDSVRQEIAQAESTEAMKAIGFILKKKSKTVQDAVRVEFSAKMKALKDGERQTARDGRPAMVPRSSCGLGQQMRGVEEEYG